MKKMYYLEGYKDYNPLNNSKTIFETDLKYVYETHYSNYADNVPVYYRRRISIERYKELTGNSFAEQVKKGLIESK